MRVKGGWGGRMRQTRYKSRDAVERDNGLEGGWKETLRLKGRLARNEEMKMWKKGCCREKEIGVKRSRKERY